MLPPDEPKGSTPTGSFVLTSRLLLITLLLVASSHAATIYVNDDAGGNDDGSSWSDAFTDLQDGLAGAGSGDQIWVAAGVYIPGMTETDTFQLISGVEIYGGFEGAVGTEDNFGARDFKTFITVLSGDIDGNDLSDANSVVPEAAFIMGANCDTVVTGSGTDGTTVLDGFTITAGQADNGGIGRDRGAGMYNDGGSPTVSNVTFSGNSCAQLGGGMHNFNNSSPRLTNLFFSGNFSNAIGGGLANDLNSSPILSSVTFFNNSTGFDRGGGMSNGRSSNPVIRNVWFIGNSAGGSGGGLSNFGSNPTLGNVIFSGNSAFFGGAMSNGGGSSPTLTNVTMRGNSADNEGGGIRNDGNSDPVIRNCIIFRNVVGTVNDQIVNVDPDSVPIIEDSMVQGGCPDAQTSCTNLIVGPPLFVDPNGPDDVRGTLDDDLRLTDGSPAIDTGNNAHLPPDATDLDGDDDTAEDIPQDLDGGVRIFDGTVDLGAYESQPSMLYVNDDATGLGSGNNWADAYTDLQNGLVRSIAGSQIWVAAGVYIPGPSEENTFQLKNGVEIYGGFEGLPGSEDDFDARDPSTFLSILSGDIDGDDITTKAVVTDTDDIVGDNTNHVVTGSGTSGTAVLDGFTITAGSTFPDSQGGAGMVNDGGSPTLSNLTFSGNSGILGGGMYNFSGSSPMLTNVTFTGNMATVGGGGGMLNFDNSSPTLINVTFSGNSAATDGGGMINYISCSPTLTRVTFSGNSASFNGGGMSNFSNCSPTLTRVTFSGNTASMNGGAMNNQSSSSPTLINVTFNGNSATLSGGGVYNIGGTSTLTNVTFAGNSATGNGGGIFNAIDSDPMIQNCIFWNNSAGVAGDQILTTTGGLDSPTFQNSLVQGSGGSGAWDTDLGDDGGGNIDENPLFVDADGMDNMPGTTDDNPRLQTGSPAIDAGDDSLVPVGVTTDLDGNPRIVDGDGDMTATVDMGAYEFQLNPATPTNSPTASSTPSPVNTEAPTATETVPAADTHTPTVTDTGAPTETHTEVPTETDTGAPTPTNTPTPTITDTGAATATNTSTPTATQGVGVGNCNLNSDNEINAEDLILLIESDPSSSNPFLFFARCWFEVAP